MLVCQTMGGRRCWDVRFIRDFNGWELDLVTARFSNCFSQFS